MKVTMNTLEIELIPGAISTIGNLTAQKISDKTPKILIKSIKRMLLIKNETISLYTVLSMEGAR